MKVRKGYRAVLEDFHQWVAESLLSDIVIDTDNFPNFKGKDQEISVLLKHNRIEHPDADDLSEQEDLLRKRRQKAKELERLRDRTREEEQSLLETINNREEKVCDENRKLVKELTEKTLIERMRRAEEKT